MDAVYRAFAGVRADRFVWQFGFPFVRILMYHGICEDELAGQPWVPDSFVPRSAFELQLQYLRQNTRVVPLEDAISSLKTGQVPDRCVVITFDDGYANNLHLAYPLAEKYDLPFTIFLSTAYIESSELFVGDRLRLLYLAGDERYRGPGNPFLQYATGPLDPVMEKMNGHWTKLRDALTDAQVRTLRPLRGEELSRFDHKLVSFGAHSHHHCILANETQQRSEWEIRQSVERVQCWTGKPVKAFAYPNGAATDFGESAKAVLRSLNIEAAVTAVSGANRPACDLLALRRYPVGLYHKPHTFVSEVAGFRSLIRQLTG